MHFSEDQRENHGRNRIRHKVLQVFMSKWRKRIANVRFAGKTRQTLSAFCLKISEHEKWKRSSCKKAAASFFARMFVFSKRKHFYCSINIPLNQYSVNSKVGVFEVKKWNENLCIFTSKQQLTIWLSGDIIMTTAVETKEINF